MNMYTHIYIYIHIFMHANCARNIYTIVVPERCICRAEYAAREELVAYFMPHITHLLPCVCGLVRVSVCAGGCVCVYMRLRVCRYIYMHDRVSICLHYRSLLQKSPVGEYTLQKRHIIPRSLGIVATPYLHV